MASPDPAMLNDLADEVRARRGRGGLRWLVISIARMLIGAPRPAQSTE